MSSGIGKYVVVFGGELEVVQLKEKNGKGYEVWRWIREKGKSFIVEDMKIIQSFNGGFNSRGASGLCGRERKRERVCGVVGHLAVFFQEEHPW